MLKLFVFAIFLASCTPRTAEVPAPQPAAPTTSTFALYGDCRDGHDVHRKICDSIAKSDAGFVINTGDLVADSRSPDLWTKYNEITKDLRAKVPIWSSKGNHDHRDGGAAFLRQFGLEKAYFDKRFGPIHFFFLDTCALDDAQLRWFETAATASDAPHKVAVFHHPPFTMMPGRVKDAAMIREKLHGLLGKLKFCGALCGHDHNFYMTRRDGLSYVISGGGGAPLYDMDDSLAQKGDLWKRANHYEIFTARPASLTAKVYAPDGSEMTHLAFTFCKHR